MSVNVIDTIKPLGDFPVADAEDIDVNGEKLSTVLGSMPASSDVEDLKKNKVDKSVFNEIFTKIN